MPIITKLTMLTIFNAFKFSVQQAYFLTMFALGVRLFYEAILHLLDHISKKSWKSSHVISNIISVLR